MQVSVEASGPIERKLTVSVPRAEVDQAIEKRLREVGRSARVPGFRPGRAPHNIIAKRYGGQVTDEVISDTINASYREALGREALKPAGLLSLQPKPFVAGDDLQFVATVEVFPEIPSPTLAGRTVEKPVCAVTDADVERALEGIRKSSAEFVARGPGERAQDGDRVTIDSEVSIDGRRRPGDSISSHKIILGEKRLFSELEDALRGATTGDARRVALTPPPQHPLAEAAAKSAAKTAEYALTVKAVERPVLPDLDDAFAAKCGVADMAKLRAEVERDLRRAADSRAQALLRERVFEALLDANPVDTPQSMVEAEIDRRWEEFVGRLYRAGRDAPALPDAEREARKPAAARQVALGLIVHEIIDNHGLKIDASEVRRHIVELASAQPDDEQAKAFVEWHYEDPARLRSVESMLLERRVVARMLETATVVEKPLSFDELTQADASAPA